MSKYFLVFSAGIIIMISSAAKMPVMGEKWPSTLVLFTVAAVYTLFMLYLWRKESAASLSESGDQAGDDNLMQTALNEVNQWKIADMAATEICNKVDSVLHEQFFPYNARKDEILQQKGFAVGAEIFVQLAYAERMFNRVWSAASDDNLPEAEQSFIEAKQALATAVEKIEAVA